ncbi:MAG TPA: AMP-binding protein, partial [Ktedonobacterales bacterium]
MPRFFSWLRRGARNGQVATEPTPDTAPPQATSTSSASDYSPAPVAEVYTAPADATPAPEEPSAPERPADFAEPTNVSYSAAPADVAAASSPSDSSDSSDAFAPSESSESSSFGEPESADASSVADVAEAAAPAEPAAPSAPPAPSPNIANLLNETRRFPPSQAFVAQATIADPSVYEYAHHDPEGFWGEAAKRLDWFKPWDKVLEWDAPWARWFVGGQLNASYNCVDRHNASARQTKPAIIWEGEPGDTRVLTYGDLYREVNRFAAVLLDLGIEKGDRVAFYMPMIPELAIGLLACARIGAPHTVIFGGFSAESLRDRIIDSQAKLCVTADGGYRRGGVVPLKDTTDAAVEECPSIEHILVVQRVGPEARQVTMREGRDVWYHEAAQRVTRETVDPEPLDSEHPLYIMYTSGTTGKPKGQLHTTAGYLTATALTHQWIFDLKEDDVYWCTADIGWVTGHSYIVYGPLANGASVVMYEGSPDYPDKDRFWAIVEKYKVTILYTAPTSIRTFMRWGTEYPERRDLSSLRLLG